MNKWRDLQLLLLGYARPLPPERQPPEDGVWEIRTLTLRAAAIELYQSSDDDELVFRDFAIAWWRGRRDGCTLRSRRSLEKGVVYEMAAEPADDTNEAFSLPLTLYRSPRESRFRPPVLREAFWPVLPC